MFFLRQLRVAARAQNIWGPEHISRQTFPEPITCADFTVIVAALKPDFTGAFKKKKKKRVIPAVKLLKVST